MEITNPAIEEATRNRTDKGLIDLAERSLLKGNIQLAEDIVSLLDQIAEKDVLQNKICEAKAKAKSKEEEEIRRLEEDLIKIIEDLKPEEEDEDEDLAWPWKDNPSKKRKI